MSSISIVIITLNEEKRIGRLLEDLSRQSHRNFEVIVVDSNSEDQTRQCALTYASELPKLSVHKMETRGVSLGRNTGANLAENERLLFLDADVRLEPDFVEKALFQLEQKGLAISGALMDVRGLAPKHQLGYSLFNSGLYITQFFFPTAVGACIFSTKTVHKAVGGFDEQISLCEDCEYVKKASKTWRYRILNLNFGFDSRRLDQDGSFATGFLYFKANVRRFFIGEMRNNEIEYKFGHYSQERS